MRRRIALVTRDYRLGGGVATVVRFLSRVLEESGEYEPEIVSTATCWSDSMSARMVSPGSWRGPQVTRRSGGDGAYRHVGAWWPELPFQRNRPRAVLSRLLAEFDLVQVVAGTPAIGCVATQCGRPVVLFTATTAAVERTARLKRERGGGRLWLRVMTRLEERQESVALRGADRVVAESWSTFYRLGGCVEPDRLVMGPPGVDVERFRPEQGSGEGYILAVGRFSDPRKNVRMLADSYRRICRALPCPPDLVLVGERPSAEDMASIQSQRIAGRVRIYEQVAEEKLAELYRRAGVFVLSSDEEGLGIVILEAMASGLPVVSTDCGGPRTAIREGETGFLTPVRDADALADAMLRLLKDPLLSRQMGAAGRRVAEKEFSITARGRVYLDRYAELLGAGRACASCV